MKGKPDLYELINIAALLLFIFVKRKNKEYSTFGIFLFYVVICESVIPPFLKSGTTERILFISLYATICTFYYQYFFLDLLRNRPYYNIHKWIFIGFFLFRFVDYSFIQKEGYHSVQYMLGMVYVFYLFFTYAYYIIVKDPFRPLREFPGIWMGIGVILFFVAVFPLIIFLDFWVPNNQYNKPYHFLMHLGNILLSSGYLLMVWFIPSQGKTADPLETQTNQSKNIASK